MGANKLFGTDGIRGIANKYPLVPELLVGIGRAFGKILKRKDGSVRPNVLVGEDGRGSCAMIRFALAAGLMGRGVNVTEGGLMTTPALALLTSIRDFNAGIMISASHNPPDHNGIKFFGADGSKISEDLEEEIERSVAEESDGDGTSPGSSTKEENILDSYRRYLAEEIVPDLFLGSFKAVLDCANGGASSLAPLVLKDMGVELHVCNNHPDGNNINMKCGSLYADLLSPVVKGEKAHIGICLDGDGDRCILIDEKGNVVDGDRILYILGKHMGERGELQGNILVCTVMSNLALRKAMKEKKIETVVTPVGDRNVAEAMKERKAVLGGEPSGHVIIADNGKYIGDGLVTAIKVMEIMKNSGLALSELVKDYKPYPQIRIDVPVREKPPLDALGKVKESIDRAEGILGDEGRIVFRYSGTEAKARIMVEGPEPNMVKEIAKEIADAVRAEIS